MRIAFVVGPFPSLSETFVLNQITGLIDLGHEVDVYANGRSGVRHHDDVDKYGLLERTFDRGMPEESHAARLLAATPILACLLWRHPAVAVKAIDPFRWGLWEAASLKTLFGANAFLRATALGVKYDAVVAHFGPQGDLAIRCREAGAFQAPVGTFFHGFDMSGWIRMYGPRAYDRLFRLGDRFWAISERWKARLLELGCPTERLSVHRMGVDTDRFTFAPRRSDPATPGGLRAVAVARLAEKKGLTHAIGAVARAARQLPGLRLDIVGDGPLRGSLEDRIQREGVGDRVTLWGPRTQDQVREHLAAAHVFLLPSVVAADGDEEGIPVALMEAFAQGLPAIATRHSGIPELVRDGENGFLVPERDEEALAAALVHFAAAPERWPIWGQAGRTRVEAEYDIHKLNRQLADRLLEMAHGR